MADGEEDGAGVGVQLGDNSQIEVYGRVRPSGKNDKSACVLDANHKAIEFRLPRLDAGTTAGFVNNKRELYEFRMAHIFDETATQADIFDGIGKNVVNNVLNGFNGTIFAYGQTGSGSVHGCADADARVCATMQVHACCDFTTLFVLCCFVM